MSARAGVLVSAPPSGTPITVVWSGDHTQSGEVLGGKTWNGPRGVEFAWHRLGDNYGRHQRLLVLADEGITWCRGWEGPDVDALRATIALAAT